MTLEEACDAYLSDVRARNLSGSSIRGYGVLFRKLGRFAAEQGLVNIDEIDAASLRQWRESWSWASSTHQTNLNRLKTFFSFALRAGWISESPAAELRPPKVDRPPTMPLGRAEVAKLVAAAEGMPRERALLLLLRYSGISIRDAATLRRDSVDGRELTLRRTKTGELVVCDLPIVVVEALASVVREGSEHYFWTGESKPRTVVNYWRARLQVVAGRAGVVGFRPHRLRDTFAVELLLAGVAMQDVSTLLGHSSIRTTERYYAPWNRSRRDRLAAIVRDAHRRDVLLQELTNTPSGTTSAEAA